VYEARFVLARQQAFVRDYMQTVLIIVHLVIVVSLCGMVLIQKSEGGGLGLGGGGSGGPGGLFTGRGQANLLTRTTAILGAGFFLTSLVLSIIAAQSRTPRSIIDEVAPPSQSQPATPSAPKQPVAPAGQGGTVLDQLRQQSAPAAPAAPTPAAPAAPAPAK
jgi:preprotein translocase subunit SecG